MSHFWSVIVYRIICIALFLLCFVSAPNGFRTVCSESGTFHRESMGYTSWISRVGKLWKVLEEYNYIASVESCEQLYEGSVRWCIARHVWEGKACRIHRGLKSIKVYVKVVCYLQCYSAYSWAEPTEAGVQMLNTYAQDLYSILIRCCNCNGESEGREFATKCEEHLDRTGLCRNGSWEWVLIRQKS